MRFSSFAAESETMHVRKTRAIGVDLEHCAFARTTARSHRPIQGAARYDQCGNWISSVAVGSTKRCREIMHVRKTRAIGVDLEHRANARTAALICRSIQG